MLLLSIIIIYENKALFFSFVRSVVAFLPFSVFKEDMTENTDDYSVDYTYSFLKGVRTDDLPATIEIPANALSQMGNMERQYWEIKSKNFNIVLFFKKGKFYELYDYDAVIGKKEFGLKMVFDTTNRGKMRLAGVPEQSFSEWARLFVFRGYKIGRVEEIKDDVPDSKRKIVPRELVEIITPGTVKDPLMISDFKELYIIALVPLNDESVDAFAIDLSRRVSYWCPCPYSESELNAPRKLSPSSFVNLLHLLRPKEVVVARGVEGCNDEVWKKRSLSMIQCAKGEGYNIEECRVILSLKELQQPSRNLLEKYLISLKIEAASLLKESATYKLHIGCKAVPTHVQTSSLLLWEKKNDHGMFIDAQSILNLELLCNLRDGSERGSVFEFINQCSSTGGKRLLTSWLLRPSASAKVIRNRQEVVQFLIKEDPVCGFHRRFSGLAFDLERQVSRLSDLQSEKHNISFVDPQMQISKNLKLIFSCVDSLKEAISWGQEFSCSFAAYSLPLLLQEILNNICECEPSLTKIVSLFDREESERSATLVPREGTFPDFDDAKKHLNYLREKLEKRKTELQIELFPNCQVEFCDVGKDIFLIDVEQNGARSVKYFVTELQPLIADFRAASASSSNAAGLTMRWAARKICELSVAFYRVFESISYFDCLLSLAKIHLQNENTCFPNVVNETEDQDAFIEAVKMAHPILGASAIPSDINLNCEAGRILLLTGPNMAGKSTLMRNIAINMILAQMGGVVSASSLAFSPLSRIFTRIGARDATHKGQSTLFVELWETGTILGNADGRSLCLIDELGRGTSTHDGLAIAAATLEHLEQKHHHSPLTIFSTHYHTLALEKEKSSQGVQLGYMSYYVTPAPGVSKQTSYDASPSITFLYALTPGICEKSFGIEVAQMANIPSWVLQMARKQSHHMLRNSLIFNDPASQTNSRLPTLILLSISTTPPTHSPTIYPLSSFSLIPPPPPPHFNL
eukprot:gene5100-3669_t